MPCLRIIDDNENILNKDQFGDIFKNPMLRPYKKDTIYDIENNEYIVENVLIKNEKIIKDDKSYNKLVYTFILHNNQGSNLY